MAEKLVWTCDGCDEERVMDGPNDWKRITVTTSGFGGYPVGDHANGERKFNLCPSCQRRFPEMANPLRWVRSEKAEPAP